MPPRNPDDFAPNNNSEPRHRSEQEKRKFGHSDRRLESKYDAKLHQEDSHTKDADDHRAVINADPPGPEGADSGPYNRRGQFEATEVDGDSPSSQISRGAHKGGRKDWQDQAKNSANQPPGKK